MASFGESTCWFRWKPHYVTFTLFEYSLENFCIARYIIQYCNIVDQNEWEVSTQPLLYVANRIRYTKPGRPSDRVAISSHRPFWIATIMPCGNTNSIRYTKSHCALHHLLSRFRCSTERTSRGSKNSGGIQEIKREEFIFHTCASAMLSRSIGFLKRSPWRKQAQQER